MVPNNWKNGVALLGGFVFYVWGAPIFALILLASGSADYFISFKFKDNLQSKKWLQFGVGLNLAMLFVFKYFNFFTENFKLALGAIGFGFPTYMEVVLPIGISFFTFQKISYLIDVHRGDSPLSKSLANYLLFVFLFPQLIAGPILRYKQLASQITERFETDSWQTRLSGFYRFALGLAKKVLIADTLAPLVDNAFGSDHLGFYSAWIGLLAYSMQIYFDFSGYSDMAIGLGKMMGFQFPENFNWPYISSGFQEFWRRWHMTLSHFMRDYLYLPLGGNKGSKFNTAKNLWIVFLLSGLWHGASWTFVIFGAWHGALITIDRFTGLFSRLPKQIAIVLTFTLVLFGWVWFRAETLADSVLYFKTLFAFQIESDISITNRQIGWLIVALVFAFAPKSLHSILQNLEESRNSGWDLVKTACSVLLSLLCLGQLAVSKGQPFIYFQF
jgi:alginate O-acetyltransferase complex protein AlgI